ncbi:MAG: carboxylate--amine ligase [Candidatus Riflebacteria bacterium]|nr:carboxylate--amine ligase [Candidatus Riflebacteria bacterium]
MNVVYISPHFPPNFVNFTAALANRGINVLGITDCDFSALPEKLKGSLAGHYRVSSLDDYSQVYKACAYFIYKYGRISWVVSHNEHWMMHEARLREDFNIQGFNVPHTVKVKQKSEMKKIFIKNGANVVEGVIVENRKTLDNFIKKHGYPVFLKPNIGVGGAMTFKIRNEDDLANFWRDKPEREYFAEPYIDGDLTTFDGITDQDGNIVFTSSLRSMQAGYAAFDEDLSFYIQREIPEDLEAIGRKVVKDFDIKANFFHFEFLRRKSDGKAFALEMNCRAPGGYVLDAINFANDMDIFAAWADIIAYNKMNQTFNRKYFCSSVSRRFSNSYVHSYDEIYKSFSEEVTAHELMPPIFSDVMGDEIFIVRTPTEKRLFEIIKFIQKKN